MENPIKMDDLGVPLFSETSRWWFQIFFIFTPKIGEDFQFDEYFSNWLKPPTSGSF